MSYQSLNFFLFVAVTLVLYYFVGLFWRKGQRWVILLANTAFFIAADKKYIPYILVTMLASFLAGFFIGMIYKKNDARLAEAQTPDEKKRLRAKAKGRARWILLASLLVTVGLLVVCKYTKFIITNINPIIDNFGIPAFEVPAVVLPIGVSFYTFMAISYVLDIYWKRYEAEKNFISYAAYLSYFSHVVQGPIDRYNEFKAQLDGGVKFDYVKVAHGAQLSLWGLFKKLVIADRLGLLVDPVFSASGDYGGAVLAFIVCVYSIQIYADFSGCIDIVRGVSEMMGIELRKNFNHPYFSKTMPEFWRRWHISLQEWFKDYIYYPVSASSLTKKVKKFFKAHSKPKGGELFASCFPILVVWMITGIWHGAAWRFVAWGMFHAALLIGSTVFEPLFKKLSGWMNLDTENFGWRFIQMSRTFLLCGIGRVFFRASGMSQAIEIFKSIFTNFRIRDLIIYLQGLLKQNFNDVTGYSFVIATLLSVIVLWIVDIMQERMPLRKTLGEQNLIFRWCIILAGIFAVLLLGIYGPGYDAASFIYEQF